MNVSDSANIPTMHRRGPWSQREDELLKKIVGAQGALNWVRISQCVGTRTPKQCRERYHQNLKPNLNHSPITPEEGIVIEGMVDEYGKRWAEIARTLENRSDNAVKNWWNGSMNRRKRLARRQNESVGISSKRRFSYFSPAPCGVESSYQQLRLPTVLPRPGYHHYSRPGLNTQTGPFPPYSQLWIGPSGLPSPPDISPTIEVLNRPPPMLDPHLMGRPGEALEPAGKPYAAPSPSRIRAERVQDIDAVLPPLRMETCQSSGKLPSLRECLPGYLSSPIAPGTPQYHVLESSPERSPTLSNREDGTDGRHARQG